MAGDDLSSRKVVLLFGIKFFKLFERDVIASWIFFNLKKKIILIKCKQCGDNHFNLKYMKSLKMKWRFCFRLSTRMKASCKSVQKINAIYLIALQKKPVASINSVANIF